MMKISPSTPADKAGAMMLREHLAVWHSLLPSVRAGNDREALHELRICGRRLMAVLRVLEAAPFPAARGLRHQARDLLRVCGVVRDLDVQIEALALLAARAPFVHFAFERRIRLRRFAAQLNLLRSLDGAQSRALFDSLERVADEGSRAPESKATAVVARIVIRDLHRSAMQAAREVAREPSVAHCHALRLAIKKLRHVAEGFVPLHGGPLKRYLSRLQRLQSLLGRINDARQLIPVFEVESARARSEAATAALAVFESEVDRQRASLQRAREALRGQQGRLAGERWHALRARLDDVARRG